MPLAFCSDSHGTIPFGFFNIETDMLLMDRYFFFSTDFCDWVTAWAQDAELSRDEKRVYVIENAASIGNLAGAIYGFEFTGFMGEIYKLFPFPRRRSGFKQKPDGTKNRSAAAAVIQPFAVEKKVPIRFSRTSRTISFGDYVFSAPVFQDMIRYVEAGGMPRWLNGQAPGYVSTMMERLAKADNPLFSLQPP